MTRANAASVSTTSLRFRLAEMTEKLDKFQQVSALAKALR